MKRNPDFDMEIDELICDDFSDLDFENDCMVMKSSDDDTPIHSDNWSIVEAFNAINNEIPMSQLGQDLYEKCAEPFEYLNNVLGFTPVQCVVVAMLVENGKAMSFRQMGKVLGISRLTMMTYYKDIEALFAARWLMHRGAQESDGMYEGYGLAKGVVTAIRENRVFVPEVLECKDIQEFVDKLTTHMEVGFNDPDRIFNDEKVWLAELVNANKELEICKLVLSLEDSDSMILLLLLIADHCMFCGSKEEGLGPREVQLVYPRENNVNYRQIINKLQNGTHELFVKNLIEHKCEDGAANINSYVVTSYLVDEVMAGYNQIIQSNRPLPRMNGYMPCNEITEKKLYYNELEAENVKRLENLLSQEQLPLVQTRLRERGMRTGVCILMHGGPGTGKTATAYELARVTGRDIIQVQVTDFKNKYVGESENRLKRIFSNYKQCCKNNAVMPILLLNEGDAILSKRSGNVEKSVDQMANSLQNILLEEMENLEGIMIVTTNLINNLDSAFERRFIFKIHFNQPSNQVRANIWKSMIEDLNDEESMELARAFDISGGEIENIARKSIMEYVLTGVRPNLHMVKNFAKEEKLKSNKIPIAGFGV